MSLERKVKVLIVSDGTGQTVRQVIKAAMAQFPKEEIFLSRHKYVKHESEITDIISQKDDSFDLIIHTIIDPRLRDSLNEKCDKNKIRCVDLMGDLLYNLSGLFQSAPSNLPGKLHNVNEQYFKRVDALEFTLNHDDGKNLENLQDADIILLGISRTSKTPLSMLLALEGYKVVNIPLVMGTTPSQHLFEINQKKVFALTIKPDELFKIRSKRLERLGVNQVKDDYSDLDQIQKEVSWAEAFFKDNKTWPVINVTNKAIEETMSEIVRLLEVRSKSYF